MLQRMREIEEMLQIEEWTEKRINNILFDSYNDWNENASIFKQRIINKEHIIIIIEYSDGNKFEGYVNSKIDKICEWINDSQSFLFSIESKGKNKKNEEN